jgi:hypothetical protein
VRAADRLVLLGDVVELLEGRPRRALAAARPPLRALAEALGPGGEIVVVPGNHDAALIRPLLRARWAVGRQLGFATRLPARATPALEHLVESLAPCRVRVQYPGVWLGEGIYATHGHYVDRHLLPRAKGFLARGPFAVLPEHARADDYERLGGPSFESMGAAVQSELPDALADMVDRTSGALRRAALSATPMAAVLMRAEPFAPLTAGALGYQFRRAGLPAMQAVIETLGVRARHVLFGHLHRTGPLPGDDLAEWRPGGPGAPMLHNAGSWIFEPLLLAGAEPPHPYWPGGAIEVEPGAPPRTVTLLDGFSPTDLG